MTSDSLNQALIAAVTQIWGITSEGQIAQKDAPFDLDLGRKKQAHELFWKRVDALGSLLSCFIADRLSDLDERIDGRFVHWQERMLKLEAELEQVKRSMSTPKEAPPASPSTT